MPAAADFPGASQILIAPIDDEAFPPRSYQVDTSFEAYRRQSTRHTTIASQRESINMEGKTGEGTVNTEGLWRIQIPDWSYGAGQLYADRNGSVANRFLASTGVNVFGLQYQATLLQATTQRQSVTSNNPLACSLGKYVFWGEGTSVWWRDTWAGSANEITLDGFDADTEFLLGIMVDDHDLYIGTNKFLYQCQVMAGSTPGTAEPVISGGIIPIGAAGGRIFGCSFGNQNYLFDLTFNANLGTPGPIPTDYNGGRLLIHTNPRWVWTSMALVDGTFYFAGYPSDHDVALIPNSVGQIWRASFGAASNSVGGSTSNQNVGLPTPQVALSLPPGEIAPNIFAYGNLCLLGTTNGVRVCRSVSANDPEGNTGDLIAGPLIPNLLQPVNGWVTGFTANGRYVWFTWTGYQDTQFNGAITGQNGGLTGAACVLGRLDMETMVDDLTPAYASDLVFAQDLPGGYMGRLDWDPITSSPMLSIELGGSGQTAGGIYTADPDNLVASGFIDSGLLTYNIPDDKIACMVSTRFYAPGTVTFAFNPDQAGYSSLGPVAPNTPSTSPELISPLVRFEEGNLSTVLTAESGNDGPTLKRVTLKSLPAVVSGTTISAVIMLYTQVNSHGVNRAVDPYAELEWLEQLRLSQQPLIYSEASPKGTLYTATCVVNSIDWLPEHEQDNARKGWDGVAVLYLTALVG